MEEKSKDLEVNRKHSDKKRFYDLTQADMKLLDKPIVADLSGWGQRKIGELDIDLFDTTKDDEWFRKE